MKWVNHRILTTAVVYGVTGNILYAGYSLLGAVLPDQLEGRPPKDGTKAYWRWRKKHRGYTHWPLPYLILIAGLYWLHLEQELVGMYWSLAQIPIYIAIGALLHILEDGICGKVPLFLPKRKIGIRLFKVGSAWEYFFTYTVILAMAVNLWKDVLRLG